MALGVAIGAPVRQESVTRHLQFAEYLERRECGRAFSKAFAAALSGRNRLLLDNHLDLEGLLVRSTTDLDDTIGWCGHSFGLHPLLELTFGI